MKKKIKSKLKDQLNLKNKIALLNLQNSRLNNLIFKNEQLNKGLNTAESIYENLVIRDFQDPYPLESMTFIPGYIVNNNFLSSTITAIVSVGAKDSIQSNQPVIDFDDYLNKESLLTMRYLMVLEIPVRYHLLMLH